MKSLSKIILYVVAIVVLSWFLPWLYNLMLPSATGSTFLHFSPISDKWVCEAPGDKSATKAQRFVEIDAEGNFVGNYNKNQRDSLVPQMFYRDLMAREQMPDTIKGVAVTVPDLRHAQWQFKTSPRDINRVSPVMYLMMESMPQRVDLEDPKEAFDMQNGTITFYEIATNTVNAKRSQRFDKALRSAGFTWPMKDASADVTARKEYDEGYLLVDADGTVFHMKQQAGRPYVKRVNMPEGVVADKAFILENMDRSNLGMVVDTDGYFYMLRRDGYKLERLPIGQIDVRRQSVMAICSLFNWVFRISDNGGAYWKAVDPFTLDLLASYDIPAQKSSIAQARNYVFPYILTFVSNDDQLAYPRIIAVSAYALILNVVLAIILLIVLARSPIKDQCKGAKWIKAAVTVVCGLFSFIPFMLMKD